ncbi:MAG: hypothetical protein M3N47_14935, partial [Chloroflexota bacterium]|nr:hypothetical protein [Chloroflexota bacterium]
RFLKSERALGPASVNLALAAVDHLYRQLGLGRANVRRELLPVAAPRALGALAAAAHAKGYADVRAALGLPTERLVADGLHVADWEALMPEVTDELFREQNVLRTRLLVTEPLLAAEADRFDAEGHLRWSVVFPAAAVVVTLGFQDHWLWLAGLLPIAMLAVQGQRRLNDGADVVADALFAEVITAPSVDRLASKINAAPRGETSRDGAA